MPPPETDRGESQCDPHPDRSHLTDARRYRSAAHARCYWIRTVEFDQEEELHEELLHELLDQEEELHELLDQLELLQEELLHDELL